MAEPTDAVMPILQRIQADVSGLKADVTELKRDMGRVMDKLTEMNGYISFNLGITSRHTFEIEALRKEGEAVKQRLRALEPQP